MSTVSTHILDTTKGSPAPGVWVELLMKAEGLWDHIAQGVTDDDGRIKSLAPGLVLRPGDYRLVFETGAYQDGFYPEVVVAFRIAKADQHYHVPLLLSPFGYSTYRGS